MLSSSKKSDNEEPQYSTAEHSSKRCCGATDVGKKRPHNEDSFLICQAKNLYIVSDGMGGYEAGEIASGIAVEHINEHFTLDLISLLRKGVEDIGSELKLSVHAANEKIIELAENTPSYRGMGCTVVAALVVNDELHLCHVGDSRAYVCNRTGIHLVTTDHSAVMDLVKSGRMSLEEARNSPAKNRLSQAVGASGPVEPEYGFCQVNDGDKIVLCSDGLWDMLSDRDIFQIVKQKKPMKYLCEKLVKAANEAGGHDNITVVVIQHQVRNVGN